MNAQRVGDLEVRERPDPEDAEGHEGRVARAEHEAAQRAGEQDAGEQRERGGDEDEGRGRPREPATALRILVVEPVAQERLAHPGAQQDAREDHERQQRLG
ncbi:MAG: hypothetical protein MUF56_06700, partial [Solirubrobacteraceae bacterium]|nr:hypothetical protein [Solirubrobacteraceae bacterium]